MCVCVWRETWRICNITFLISFYPQVLTSMDVSCLTYYIDGCQIAIFQILSFFRFINLLSTVRKRFKQSVSSTFCSMKMVGANRHILKMEIREIMHLKSYDCSEDWSSAFIYLHQCGYLNSYFPALFSGL